MRPMIIASPQPSGNNVRPPPPPGTREVSASEWRSTCGPPADDIRIEQNRKRSAGRDFQKPYLKEMAAAHAQGREPVIEIPVSESGIVLALKSPWHAMARLCARQTLNFRVRSYKAKHQYWMSQVECIAEKLSKKFTYTHPLDIKYLAKFLKNSMKNDRKSWKKYFIKFGGMKHHRCPTEAFTEWRKYWVSAAGRDESVHMSELRKGKNKTLRTDCPPLTSEDGSQGHLLYQVLPGQFNFNPPQRSLLNTFDR